MFGLVITRNTLVGECGTVYLSAHEQITQMKQLFLLVLDNNAEDHNYVIRTSLYPSLSVVFNNSNTTLGEYETAGEEMSYRRCRRKCLEMLAHYDQVDLVLWIDLANYCNVNSLIKGVARYQLVVVL